MSTDPITAIIERVVDLARNALHKLGQALLDMADALRGVDKAHKQAEETKQAETYHHLIDPPRDHTLAHVTHTRTKPPRPHRIHRRVTL